MFAQQGATSSDGRHFVEKMLKTELGSLLLLHTCSFVNIRTREALEVDVPVFFCWMKRKCGFCCVCLAVVISCSPILKNCAARRPVCHDSVQLKKGFRVIFDV